MTSIPRRSALAGMGAFLLGGSSLAGYAHAESWNLVVRDYRVTPPDWPQGFGLKIAALADIHACHPWMSLDRIVHLVERTNALGADVIVLLGDFVAGDRMNRVSTAVDLDALAKTLSGLRAPLGVHAVLGNHDWWEDAAAQKRRAGPTLVGQALERVGIAVHENNAVRLTKGQNSLWLAGLGDQWAFLRRLGRNRYSGVDDLGGTLAKVTDDAPVLLLVHEPDIFVDVPPRVSLTLAGHTHGGQIRIMGFAPVVPSRFGRRFTYGHIVEEGRHLIVSGGIGCSGLPLRLGRPPEIVQVYLGKAGAQA